MGQQLLGRDATVLQRRARAASKSLELPYSTIGRVRVILNYVKDPSSDSTAPLILRLSPQDDTSTHDCDTTISAELCTPH